MKRVQIDCGRVTELAASGLSQPKVAETLGVTYGTFMLRLSNDPEARAAWELGVSRRAGKDSQPKASAKPKVTETPVLKPVNEPSRVPGLTGEQQGVFRAIQNGFDRATQIRIETGLDYDVIDMAAFRLKGLGLITGWEDPVSGANRWAVAEKQPANKAIPDRAVQQTNGHKAKTTAAIEKAAEKVDTLGARLDVAAPAEVFERAVHEQAAEGAKEEALANPPAVAWGRTNGFGALPMLCEGTVESVSHIRSIPVRALEAARVELLYQRVWGQSSPRCSEVVELIEEQLELAVGAAS